MRRLLSNVNVVELAEGVVGAACGKLFGDLGADVVKVERPGGDPLRHEPSGPLEREGSRRSGAFMHFNTNKRGVILDPEDPEATGHLWALLAHTDLVVEIPGQGSLSTYGLGWESLHARFPAVTVISISGFGATGDYAGYRWSDLVAQAVSGAMLLQGDPDQDPLRLPGRSASCLVANLGALAGLAALQSTRSGAEGVFIDCSAVEALATLPSKVGFMLGYEYRGRTVVEQAQAGATLIPNGVFPCADGYVAMMSTPQQLPEMLDVLGDDALRAAFARPDAYERGDTKEILDAALYPWLLSHTRAEITDAAQTRGWPLAGVNHPAEVLESDHLHQRGFWIRVEDPAAGPIDLPGPPARYDEGGFQIRRLAPRPGEHDAELLGRASREPVGASRPRTRWIAPPLDGIRVVDFTAVWSGPYATQLLADLGAEVIRVENPFVLPPTTKGYEARPTHLHLGNLGSLYGPVAPGQPDRPWNRHAMNNSLARNKLSVTIDTRRDEGRELVLRLAECSDVFIENFKASGLERVGIQVSELRQRNPRLIVVRMPPAGTSGDWAQYSGFGAQFDGLSGLAWLCGHRDSDLMTTPPTTFMDGASGPAAAFATVAALHYRAVTGRGQVIELAQLENVIQQLGDVMVDCELGVEPERLGNRDTVFAPQGLYRCAGMNAWLAISVTDDTEWAGLARALGRPELADAPHLRHAAGRRAHHDELDELIGAWAGERDRTEAFHELQRHGVPAGPLLDHANFVEDPHVLSRGWLRPLRSADVGTHPHAGAPFRGLPDVWRRGSPVLGEDNDYVYRTLLGADDADIERYRAERMMADDYLDQDGNPL